MPNEERIKILKMLEDGKIKADEAARLLEAVEGPAAASGGAASAGPGRTLHIRVYKRGAATPNVNVNVPLTLAKWALKFAPAHGTAHIGDREIDLDELGKWLDGAPGEVITVNDEDEGQRVEIFVA